MSTPRRIGLPSNVIRADAETGRGTFAALTCRPRGRSLPRGNVLLIPGFTGSKEDFAALLPLLADAGWAVATYDQRGQFESPCSAGDDLSLAGFGSDALDVSRALFGTSERVHVVGHSFGGLVAAAAALADPSAWASLTLLCSGPGGLAEDQRRELLEAVHAFEHDSLECIYQRQTQPEREGGEATTSPQIEAWLHRRFVGNSAASLAAIAGHLADAPDRTAQLAALDLPVRIVRGEWDDAWPHVVQDRLAEALGTRVVVIPEAAHSPAWEQPEETRDALVRLWLS